MTMIVMTMIVMTMMVMTAMTVRCMHPIGVDCDVVQSAHPQTRRPFQNTNREVFLPGNIAYLFAILFSHIESLHLSFLVIFVCICVCVYVRVLVFASIFINTKQFFFADNSNTKKDSRCLVYVAQLLKFKVSKIFLPR